MLFQGQIIVVDLKIPKIFSITQMLNELVLLGNKFKSTVCVGKAKKK